MGIAMLLTVLMIVALIVGISEIALSSAHNHRRELTGYKPGSKLMEVNVDLTNSELAPDNAYRFVLVTAWVESKTTSYAIARIPSMNNRAKGLIRNIKTCVYQQLGENPSDLSSSRRMAMEEGLKKAQVREFMFVGSDNDNEKFARKLVRYLNWTMSDGGGDGADRFSNIRSAWENAASTQDDEVINRIRNEMISVFDSFEKARSSRMAALASEQVASLNASMGVDQGVILGPSSEIKIQDEIHQDRK